mmetsp:Transcript_48611/g.121711  ORF Transcript_48611/g.121711 Transcript_48611/m.121711 type:complete len:231 (-) Transcript_48611:729-1421(-)
MSSDSRLDGLSPSPSNSALSASFCVVGLTSPWTAPGCVAGTSSRHGRSSKERKGSPSATENAYSERISSAARSSSMSPPPMAASSCSSLPPSSELNEQWECDAGELSRPLSGEEWCDDEWLKGGSGADEVKSRGATRSNTLDGLCLRLASCSSCKAVSVCCRLPPPRAKVSSSVPRLSFIMLIRTFLGMRLNPMYNNVRMTMAKCGCVRLTVRMSSLASSIMAMSTNATN